MAYVNGTSPTAGDDFGDWLINYLLPFVRDNMGWVDNQCPSQSPDLTLGNPTSELWTHRGAAAQRSAGSPGVGSPLNVSPRAEPPFIFLRSQGGSRGYLATGFGGTDASQEMYDQPNNPCNGPRTTAFDWQVSREEMQIIPAGGGPYDAYWLFGASDGSYAHCVIQMGARNFRHLWFGMLDRFSQDVDPDSFYVCGHWCEGLDDTIDIIPPTNPEHEVYANTQLPPGSANSGSQALDGVKHQHHSVLYSPGLRSDSPTIDWYYSTTNTGPQSISKPVGDVNASLDVGNCQFTGYGSAIGGSLFRCDESFTAGVRPLVPILCFVNTLFGGVERWGCIGKIPDVYRINCRDITPGTEIVVGSDTYVVFPVTNNDAANTTTGEPYSGYEGFAYKKILGSP